MTAIKRPQKTMQITFNCLFIDFSLMRQYKPFFPPQKLCWNSETSIFKDKNLFFSFIQSIVLHKKGCLYMRDHPTMRKKLIVRVDFYLRCIYSLFICLFTYFLPSRAYDKNINHKYWNTEKVLVHFFLIYFYFIGALENPQLSVYWTNFC